MGVTANRGKEERYTNLSDIYLTKMFIFIGIALFTIWQAAEFKELMLGTVTFLIGIMFDFKIVSCSNNGPKRKVINVFSKVSFYIIMGTIILIIAFLLSGYSLKNTIIEHNISIATYILIVGFAVISPLVEIWSNRPKDD